MFGILSGMHDLANFKNLKALNYIILNAINFRFVYLMIRVEKKIWQK